MGWIYIIKNTRTKSVYVGMTTNQKAVVRWTQHLAKLKTNTHPNFRLQKAWRLFGPASFVFQPLFQRPNQRSLLQSETGLIKYLRFNGVGLYNYGDGGAYIPAVKRAQAKRKFDLARPLRRLDAAKRRRAR